MNAFFLPAGLLMILVYVDGTLAGFSPHRDHPSANKEFDQDSARVSDHEIFPSLDGDGPQDSGGPSATRLDWRDMARRGRDLTLDMGRHALRSYLENAYPLDELDSLSCEGTDSFGGFMMTLVDSLDTMVLLGEVRLFQQYAREVCRVYDSRMPAEWPRGRRHKSNAARHTTTMATREDHVWNTDNYGAIPSPHESPLSEGFEPHGIDAGEEEQQQPAFVSWHDTHNVTVSVFETNIRIVGGLLSAHLMYTSGIVPIDPSVHNYDGCLLKQAEAVAARLLPAFDTPTGIPYGSIHYLDGVLPDESNVTSVSGAGTFLLEFTALSALTGDDRFALAARRAAIAVFNCRSQSTGLIGSHLDLITGATTLPQSGVGTGMDSYFEYLLKFFVMTGDAEALGMWDMQRRAISGHVRKGVFHHEVVSVTGKSNVPIHNSLASFYPGLLALAGEIDEAERLTKAQHVIFRRFGGMPEGLNLWNNRPHQGQEVYPLRPEHVESLYYMWQVTGEPQWVEAAFEAVLVINTRTRVLCGFAGLSNVAPTGSTTPKAVITDADKFKRKLARRKGERKECLYYLLAKAAAHTQGRSGFSSDTTAHDGLSDVASPCPGEDVDYAAPGGKIRDIAAGEGPYPPTWSIMHDAPPSAKLRRANGEQGAYYQDRMSSFMLAETIKYLLLTFESALRSGGDRAFSENTGHGESVASESTARRPGRRFERQQQRILDAVLRRDWLFTTEGHMIPLGADQPWAAYFAELRHRTKAEDGDYGGVIETESGAAKETSPSTPRQPRRWSKPKFYGKFKSNPRQGGGGNGGPRMPESYRRSHLNSRKR